MNDPDEVLARLAAIVDSAGDAIVSKTLDGTVTSWNRAAEKLFGYAAAEAIGQPITLIIPPERLAEEAYIIRRLRRGESVDPFETVRVAKGGRSVVVSVAISPLRNAAGEIVGASKIARDITERQRGAQARALLAAIVESSDDAIVSKTLDGTIASWNRAAEQLFGYRAEEAIGQPITLIIPPERLAEETEIISRLRRGETIEHFDTVRLAKGGARVCVSITVSPVRDAAGEVVGASKIARDITERKRTAEALQRAQAALAHANRVTTLGVLAASIAHEVNQPLGAMVTSAASCSRWLAAAPPDFDKAQRALERIGKDGRRASDIIDRIRTLVQRQAPRRDRFDVNDAILEVVALTRDAVRTNEISLETALAQDLPAVEGDRVQLQQVILNLVINAIEAMSAVDDRQRELAIRSAKHGQALRVEVLDSGPGIDPERAELLFEAFYTTRSEAIGMGLSISRSIIEAHGGRLWASPNQPHGAAFRFSLPLQAPASAAGSAAGS
jgi:PAS domain S-box-containing protein